ncbi:speckle-type POZ protein B-like [Argiope bruennichi]|nr:speckle-type POZ protein B-like [Argiope bruennichi]
MTRDAEKSFLVTWRIENYDFCQSTIRSPSFFIDSAKGNYFFELTPKSLLRKDHVVFQVQKEVRDSFQICFKASFSTDDSSSPLYEGYIDMNTGLSSACYVPHSQVYARKRVGFLPPKTLTIRCKICKIKGSFSEEGRCFARTRIRVIKKAFIGFVEGFSYLTSDEWKTLTIKSSSTEKDFFKIDLTVGGDFCCKEKVWIDIIPKQHERFKYGKCELFLIDTLGIKTKCGRAEITVGHKEQKFPLDFTRGFLLKNNTQLLPNDTLTLKFEIAFSSGVEYEEIEDSEFGDLGFFDTNRSKFTSALEDLTSLYENGMLCDAMLQTKTELFGAHKVILSARSSVFRSMFTTDMKEKETNIVEIEDLDGNTVRRMLLFMYSDKLEDLDWESAKDLYFAANKYNIASLTHKCSNLLVSSLEL